VAPGASFPLSVPIDGTPAERFPGLDGFSSSGVALCTRELVETLAGQGIDCRVLTTGILEPERETLLDSPCLPLGTLALFPPLRPGRF
jgi:hypothetical protein